MTDPLKVRKTVDKEFKSVLEDYRKQVREPADAPSLATVPFSNDRVGFVIRYYKGEARKREKDK
jgi:hypothetical protein